MTSGNLLPDGWTVVPLGELGTWGSGGTPPRTNPDFYTESGIPWLVIGDLNDATVHEAKNHITESGLKNSAAKLLNPGTLLVAMYGSIGKLGITGMPCATNQAIASCNPSSELVTLRFLYYTLKNEQPALVAQGQGGAQQNISQTILKAHPVPLPPLQEQTRIADKLDTLLARVDAGLERLERVPKLIKQLRQSVLSAAMSGELTREWRGDTEVEWESRKFGDLVNEITQGWSPTCDKDPASHHQWGVIKTTAIQAMSFSDHENKRLPEGFEPRRHLEIRTGDLLITRKGPRVRAGIACFVRKTRPNLMLCDTVYRIRLNQIVSGEFAEILLNSPEIQTVIDGLKAGISESGLNLTHASLLGIKVSIPARAEQAEIVRRIEALFAIADRLETRYQTALTSFDRLTPALLAKAFRGELVLQDPSEEPASVLLDRIRAQRESIGGKATRGAGKRGQPTKEKDVAASGEQKRRGQPRKAPDVPTALSEEDAVRLLKERGQARAEGSRQVSLFGEET